MLRQRGGRRGSTSPGRRRRRARKLVAPETIGPPMAAGRCVERLAQAREQRVAREVAEGVVVVLEAVEVEEEQHRRVGGAGPRGASRSAMSWRRLGSPVRLSLVAAASSSRRDARSDSAASVMSTRATARMASGPAPMSPMSPVRRRARWPRGSSHWRCRHRR